MKLIEGSFVVKVYSLIFVSLILVFLLVFVPFPVLTISTLSTDFRWQSNLIEAFTNVRLVLGDRVFTGAVVGRDGWFFYTGERSIFDFQNTDPFKKRDLALLKSELDQLGAELKQKGKTLLIVIAPDKSTIYPQYMPEQIPVIGKISRLDQFYELMKSDENVKTVDLRTVLINASKSQEVYFKLDTHWNDLGAYYSYVEILKALSGNYPSLIPRPLSDFTQQSTGYTVRDISRLIGDPGLKEESWILVPKFPDPTYSIEIPVSSGRFINFSVNKETNLPTLLVFGDSFYNPLSKFMGPHFSKITVVPYVDKSWSLKWIDQESPDIVMIEFVERYGALIPALLNGQN